MSAILMVSNIRERIVGTAKEARVAYALTSLFMVAYARFELVASSVSAGADKRG